jgi:hypothetical protein
MTPQFHFGFYEAAKPDDTASRWWLKTQSANAISYAKFYSRSHDAVIRVYDEAGDVIETHEHASEFKEW